MTIPYLHNCPHIDNGWCIECMGELYRDELVVMSARITELERREAYFKDRQIKDTAELVQQRSKTLAAEATIQRVRALCSGIYGNRTDTGKMILDIINTKENDK